VHISYFRTSLAFRPARQLEASNCRGPQHQTACTGTRLRLHHGIFEFGSGPNAQSLGEREERELFIRNNVHEVVCPVTAALHGPMWAGLTLKETEVPGPRYHG